VNRLPHRGNVLSAEELRDDNASTRGEAHEEAENGVDDLVGRTDCRQSLLSDEITDNHRVHDVVELLEEISRQQRNGEFYEEGNDFPVRHVKDFCFVHFKSTIYYRNYPLTHFIAK